MSPLQDSDTAVSAVDHVLRSADSRSAESSTLTADCGSEVDAMSRDHWQRAISQCCINGRIIRSMSHHGCKRQNIEGRDRWGDCLSSRGCAQFRFKTRNETKFSNPDCGKKQWWVGERVDRTVCSFPWDELWILSDFRK